MLIHLSRHVEKVRPCLRPNELLVLELILLPALELLCDAHLTLEQLKYLALTHPLLLQPLLLLGKALDLLSLVDLDLGLELLAVNGLRGRAAHLVIILELGQRAEQVAKDPLIPLHVHALVLNLDEVFLRLNRHRRGHDRGLDPLPVLVATLRIRLTRVVYGTVHNSFGTGMVLLALIRLALH